MVCPDVLHFLDPTSLKYRRTGFENTKGAAGDARGNQ